MHAGSNRKDHAQGPRPADKLRHERRNRRSNRLDQFTGQQVRDPASGSQAACRCGLGHGHRSFRHG
ncbi:hypothetical protein RAA17_10220 [Komagataeibacter rhaeticus]|nr:hypothetical protein [Komagataeibacter rhaeticus]